MSKQSTLHLCNSLSQLLHTLCDAIESLNPLTIVFLEDEIDLPTQERQKILQALPHVKLAVTTDKKAIDEFANLPASWPAGLRRNIRVFGTPRNWAFAPIRGQQFQTVYMYNTGFFLSKVVSGLSKTIILREGGLNNYTKRPVSGVKCLFRLMAGYEMFRQTLGEERWVNQVAVSRPDDLPRNIRKKGTFYSLSERLERLDKNQRNLLCQCVGADFSTPVTGEKTALLLTQPLERVGMCDAKTKVSIYRSLVQNLFEQGYEIFVKNHPRETPYPLPNTTILDAKTPIELWPVMNSKPFDLAVALCSASLSQNTNRLCRKPIQLVKAENYHAEQFDDWAGSLNERLLRAVAS